MNKQEIRVSPTLYASQDGITRQNRLKQNTAARLKAETATATEQIRV